MSDLTLGCFLNVKQGWPKLKVLIMSLTCLLLVLDVQDVSQLKGNHSLRVS